MSLWSKIRGTIETIFQFGLNGPQIKANGAALENRDNADAAFAIMRGATPVAGNDFATKAYVDAGPVGAVEEIRYVITNAASQPSTTSIPANAFVWSAEVSITTPFSAGATISLGRTGALALIQATTDNLAIAAGLYQVPQDTPWGGAALPVIATIAGAPAAGAGVVIVRYSVPNV